MWWLLVVNLGFFLCAFAEDIDFDGGSTNMKIPKKKFVNNNVPVVGNFSADYVKNHLDIVEQMLAKREMSRMDKLLQSLQKQNYEIQGFYHTSTWRGFWKDVVSEQLYLLDGRRKFPQKKMKVTHNTTERGIWEEEIFIPDYASYEWDQSTNNNPQYYTSLLNISTGLYMNIVGEQKSDYDTMKTFVNSLKLKHGNKITFNFNETIGRGVYHGAKPEEQYIYGNNTELSTGEYSTIQKLHAYCKQKSLIEKKKAIVYYFHSKGSCCQKSSENDYQTPNPVATWREYMNTMNLEFPSICLRSIFHKKYFTCGVENQDAHYSGNYWYADCDHVALLPPIPTRWDYTAAEFFIHYFSHDFHLRRLVGFQCGYSIHNCGVNLYDFECSRERFREKLVKSTMFKLMSNPVHTKLQRQPPLDETQAVTKCRNFLNQNKDKSLSYLQAQEQVKQII